MTTRCQRFPRLAVVWVGVALLPLMGCENRSTVGPDDAPSGPSRAFGIWSPGPDDTCTPAIHDQYAVVGPDGKLYPTWHPPVDPVSGCTFGHEHGRDPRGSHLYSAVGSMPFGYANEAGDLFAPHVGYKIEWENDVEMSLGFGDVGEALLRVTCDVLVALHQGSAGSGAFVNPHHELQYHAKCSDGTQLHFAKISTIGHLGEFSRSCESDVPIVVAPNPDNVDGGGRRLIPDRTCVERHVLVPDGTNSSFGSGLRESWQMSESLRSADGQRLASVGPYFNVFNPARYYDPSAPDLVGNAVDLCYEVLPDGRRARGGRCEDLVVDTTVARVPWNDPRSPFDGAHRDVDINSIRISNRDGPNVWYTDAWGRNGRTEPFPNSLRQFIATMNNEVVTPSGPSIGRNRPYSGMGVHAPN